MARTRALKTIARSNRSLTPMVFSPAHIHTPFRQKIFARSRMDMGCK